MAIGSTLSVGLIGLKAFIVQVQAFISPGLPYFSIIGLPDASLSEARERVKSACQATGFGWPQTRVTVNMSPAAMPKRGSSHDLAIAASVLCAAGAIGHDCLEDTIVLGEVNLDGSVLPIHGLLPIMLHAEERGVRKMIVPHRNLDEASMVDGLDVVGVRHVGELIELMGGDATYTIPDTPVTDETTTDQSPTSHPNDCGDMNEVLGQEHAKWALQVAAAGGHNLIMTGPPGSGKTMLASRMPGIMCPLNEAEQLEVASIRSLCGILPQYGITDMPPFEAPHHTASTAALVGGGSGIAVPGAITRAHRGILFLDEAPEFSARALQTNHWNPGMWRFPVQKAAPTTRPHSNSSWRPTPVRADTITAPANVALAGKKTVYVISRDCPDRYWIVWIFRWRCHQSRALPRKASQSASPVPGYKLV